MAELAVDVRRRVGMCGSCAMTVNGRPRWTDGTRDSTGWPCFIGPFLAAVAVHAPLGLREWTPLRGQLLAAGLLFPFNAGL